MGRAPCCDKANVKKGPWSPEEDAKLKEYIEKHGTGNNWIALPQKAGLKRCGKSCRLRWLNYLRPNIKHGDFTEEEDRIICNLFASIGSRWSVIAAQLPGRTDNDIKNYWNTKLKKKLVAVAPRPPPPLYHQASNRSLSSSSSSSPLSSSSTISSLSFTGLEPMITTSSPYSSTLLNCRSNEASLINVNPQESFLRSALKYPQVRAGAADNRTCYSICRVKSENTGHGSEDHLGFECARVPNHQDIGSPILWGGNNVDQTPLMDYGLEEINELISSTTTNHRAFCTTSNNNFLFDENKTEEKFMLYY